MDEIILHKVLPAVFADQTPASSDLWLQHVCFSRGRHYLVEAASGTGKSSLCSFIYGARKDYRGEIMFDGVDISQYDINRWVEVRRRHIAYLSQGMDIFPELTARENIQLKNRLTGYKSMSQIESMAQAVAIDHKLDSPAGLLSIGQQQRVALVRTLCQPCDFILLDEPVSHLDAENNRLAANLVMTEAAAQGAGIITTSVGNTMLIGNARRFTL